MIDEICDVVSEDFLNKLSIDNNVSLVWNEFMYGRDDELLYLSNDYDFGSWTGMFILSVIDLSEYDDDTDDFIVSFGCIDIRPFMRSKEKRIEFFMGYTGYNREDAENYMLDADRWKEYLAETLYGYGRFATLDQSRGADPIAMVTDLFERKTNPIQAMVSMIGFFLDSPQNALGASGWDFMKGKVF